METEVLSWACRAEKPWQGNAQVTHEISEGLQQTTLMFRNIST